MSYKCTLLSDLSIYGDRSISIAIDLLKALQGDPTFDRPNVSQGEPKIKITSVNCKVKTIGIWIKWKSLSE